jgi:hypothetical protein
LALIPFIDFCNHVPTNNRNANWEPKYGEDDQLQSIQLISLKNFELECEEVNISYGDKGNEELLYQVMILLTSI